MITLQCKLTFEDKKDKQELKKNKAIKQINKDIKLLQSLDKLCFKSTSVILVLKHNLSKPQTQEPDNQRKEQVRGYERSSYKLWQVVKAALTIPVLDRSLSRDLSPLKPILVEGEWERVVNKSGLVPVAWERGEGDRRNTASWGVPVAIKAEYKYPSPKCES